MPIDLFTETYRWPSGHNASVQSLRTQAQKNIFKSTYFLTWASYLTCLCFISVKSLEYQNLPQKITVSIKFLNNHTAPYCLQSGAWQLYNKEPSFPLLTLQESAAVPTQDVVYMCGYNLQASSWSQGLSTFLTPVTFKVGHFCLSVIKLSYLPPSQRFWSKIFSRVREGKFGAFKVSFLRFFFPWSKNGKRRHYY